MLAALALAAQNLFAADQHVEIDAAAFKEIMPLAVEAFAIQQRAAAREAEHTAKLRAKGIAEEPASFGDRHVIDVDITGVAAQFGLGQIEFNDFGQLYVDRRFVTDEEMKVIYAIEDWIRRHFAKEVRPRQQKIKTSLVPVFRGFEASRYQVHDELIVRLVEEFNADKAKACGGTAEQAAKIEDLTPAIVKAHMIEESGGNGPRSKAAWAAEDNVRAAIKYLSRKGFTPSAKPASLRPNGFFDGWLKALQRYNGRRDRTDTDRYYSDEYADKIVRRAKNPDLFVPIEIKLK